MKQRLFCSICALIFAVLAFAQDIIVTRDAKKIDAKILEVSKSEIRYKELDNLEGPTFILSTNDIVTIIYVNGKVVLYNQNASEQRPETEEGEKREKANTTLSGMFGTNTGPGDDSQNAHVGRGAVGGNTWSLSRRKIIVLPKPSTEFNQEGRVVVQIHVNEEGDVIEAECIEGTSISDYQTRQCALNAAKKAKFSRGEREQIGTITYIFKLN